MAGLDSWKEALKAVKWNLMLKQGPQDVGHTKTIGCPLRKAANRGDPAKEKLGVLEAVELGE